jgi:uncharacterized protein (TIGR02453 family)
MESAFHGFGPEAFAWFAGLERDNSRTYFTATRERYEHDVRGELESILDELSVTFGGTVRVFRQQRDLRFSPDKTPYKLRTYGALQGAPGTAGGLYAELSSRGLYAASGLHRLARDQLERYRLAVAEEDAGASLADATEAAREAGLELHGASLTAAPRGYPRDHPRIELLRHTALFAGRRLPGKGGIGRDRALDHVTSTWRAAGLLNAWLDANVGPSEIAPRRR